MRCCSLVPRPRGRTTWPRHERSPGYKARDAEDGKKHREHIHHSVHVSSMTINTKLSVTHNRFFSLSLLRESSSHGSDATRVLVSTVWMLRMARNYWEHANPVERAVKPSPVTKLIPKDAEDSHEHWEDIHRLFLSMTMNTKPSVTHSCSISLSLLRESSNHGPDAKLFTRVLLRMCQPYCAW